MKILMITGHPFIQKGPDYYTVYSWPKFPEKLSQHCEQLTLWADIGKVKDIESVLEDAWKIDCSRLQIVHGPFGERFHDYFRKWVKYRKITAQTAASLVQDHDVIIIRLPSPALPLLMRQVRKHAKPVVFLVGGSSLEQSERLANARGLSKHLVRFIIKVWLQIERYYAKKAKIVFVWNQREMARFAGVCKCVLPMVTPMLSKDEFSFGHDKCQANPVKILRVSWLRPTKGLETLLKSIAVLRERGMELRLDLVGKEYSPGYTDVLKKISRHLGINEIVCFRGWVPYDQMAGYYIDSDIQVISSEVEGTPRCILEGAARGLPLVSTNVDGCKEVLTDGLNALLVPANDPIAIADSVERLTKNSDLRKALISGGYSLADSFSFEKIGFDFLGEIKHACSI